MKEYTVRPNKDADAWFLKIEDVAPEQDFDKKNDAIEAGEKVAQENKPSRLVIYNHLNEVEDEKNFK
ncbi:DUF2188 domain-containing protein [Salipaludibacillus sp. CUR1]|uniref:DUF2188 domain-containing protein n=1 Tax=Salipaludibacillus aurantiacus TaxID=1601833 RepID=A0A1H9UYJ5_9BACI|nr:MULTISPECIES: DUF2188 domain-containing protein [Salipaludibacillus]MCE7794018.1 DUF2188 domain-containing protein [Salipaludibacillus sp. CUR1]SES14492.1 hypothetical protein SAMN05518684_1092 [Salipaludibacillus aurantiacus]